MENRLGENYVISGVDRVTPYQAASPVSPKTPEYRAVRLEKVLRLFVSNSVRKLTTFISDDLTHQGNIQRVLDEKTRHLWIVSKKGLYTLQNLFWLVSAILPKTYLAYFVY